MRGLWSSEVAPVLQDASFAYLAVQTSSGPHVTPLLFAATPDRLWFGIGRGTLKARVVAKRPAVAAVVPGWMAPGGPVALPAIWDPQAQRARVPASGLREAGGSRTAAACVCVDESDGLGPLAKRGELLRGKGHAVLEGDVASVALEVE